LSTLKAIASRYRADLAMTIIIMVWGFHYIVLKEGVSEIAPLTYNALRFAVGLPVISLVAVRHPSIVHISRQDVWKIVVINLFGSVAYQALLTWSIKLTTATNVALLAATSPAWVALLSMIMGIVITRRRMLIGIGVTFGGVALVVLSRAGFGLALSYDDLIGSALILAAAFMAAFAAIYTKPLVDRLGGLVLAVWSYWVTTAGLLALDAPALFSLSPHSLPLRVVPNLLYSGTLSAAIGYIVWNYALRVLGPTRASTYNNFTPIVAALAGIIVLGEPFSPGLLAGGILTLTGVVLVRRNTFIRPPGPPAPRSAGRQPEPVAAVAK
jgi:drug/metabolite transporter (DMT)-like permease